MPYSCGRRTAANRTRDLISIDRKVPATHEVLCWSALQNLSVDFFDGAIWPPGQCPARQGDEADRRREHWNAGGGAGCPFSCAHVGYDLAWHRVSDYLFCRLHAGALMGRLQLCPASLVGGLWHG